MTASFVLASIMAARRALEGALGGERALLFCSSTARLRFRRCVEKLAYGAAYGRSIVLLQGRQFDA
jgi:hypothetical protein